MDLLGACGPYLAGLVTVDELDDRPVEGCFDRLVVVVEYDLEFEYGAGRRIPVDSAPSAERSDLTPEVEADFIEAQERLQAQIEALGDRRVRLQDLVKRYRLVSVPLWSGGVSRRDYLGP